MKELMPDLIGVVHYLNFRQLVSEMPTQKK